MRHAACVVPAAPVYKGASFETEMVNQLLFGDAVEVLETTPQFWHIRGMADHYPGWVNPLQLTGISETEANALPEWITDTALCMLETDAGIMQVPFGSTLRGWKGGAGEIGGWRYRSRIKPLQRTAPGSFPLSILPLLEHWRNAPYCWGGRTVLGVDCSGFTQMVFKVLGVDLRRDASEQAEQGQPVDFLAQAKLGDLAFFDNAEGRIIHVGLLLGNGEIIHASGSVRIDQIDHAGIMHTESGRRTHQLRIIKRYF